jgi:ubiquinone biosynthesis protein Coq4
MPRTVNPDLVEPIARILRGAIDTGDGGTEEQHSVLSAIVTGFLGRSDVEVEALDPLSPAEAADAVVDPAARRRVREMMVLLESCRHPLTDDQVSLVEEYAAALGESGPGLVVARDLVNQGAAQALADYMRYSDEIVADMAEQSLVAGYMGKDTPAPELAEQLRALHDLPEGTLGWEYVEFYRRNNLTYPGDDPNQPAVFVAHDMTHVIAGYEPTGPGEICLGAFILATNDTDPHWIGFLGNVAIHEAGYFNSQGFEGKTATLMRPGAIELLANAFDRGSQCTADFTTVDHLALADVPLTEVRARFGIPDTGRLG